MSPSGPSIEPKENRFRPTIVPAAIKGARQPRAEVEGLLARRLLVLTAKAEAEFPELGNNRLDGDAERLRHGKSRAERHAKSEGGGNPLLRHRADKFHHAKVRLVATD